jgi:hypothetical protein
MNVRTDNSESDARHKAPQGDKSGGTLSGALSVSGAVLFGTPKLLFGQYANLPRPIRTVMYIAFFLVFVYLLTLPSLLANRTRDLGYDQRIQLIRAIEQQFQIAIPDEQWQQMETVGQLADYVEKHRQLKRSGSATQAAVRDAPARNNACTRPMRAAGHQNRRGEKRLRMHLQARATAGSS